MAIELSRIAHFYGEGLPTPAEVLRAELGEKGVVYFLSQYDRHAPQQLPILAATAPDNTPVSFLENGRFKGDETENGHLYRTMLAHAAIYGEALEVNEEDKQAIRKYEDYAHTDAILRQARVYRARHLPHLGDIK